jgi:cobalt/nickel transport system permease protein
VQVRFSPPPCPDSPLARLDPRWRLLALLLALIVAAFLHTLLAATVALAGALLLAFLARMPWDWFGSRLLLLAVPLAVFVLPAPFLAGGDFLDGARLAGLFTLKAAGLATLAAVLLVSAPLDATLKAAHALYLPGLLIQLTLLSYRYLFVLGDELARLRVALRVRGFRNRANRHSYRTVGHACGTLLVRGYERAERVSSAMRCRGFDGRFRSLADFRTRLRDVLALATVAGAGAGLVGLDVWLNRR